jgi:hypothetical protein
MTSCAMIAGMLPMSAGIGEGGILILTSSPASVILERVAAVERARMLGAASRCAVAASIALLARLRSHPIQGCPVHP